MSVVPRRRLTVRENALELDGADISASVSHIELTADGMDNQAVLHLNGNHTLDVDLMASVSVARLDDLDRFLSSVDPEKLERTALDRMQGGNLTSVMLDVLREWAADWDWEPEA